MDIENSVQSIIDITEREKNPNNSNWTKDILFFANDALKQYKKNLNMIISLKEKIDKLSDEIKNKDGVL